MKALLVNEYTTVQSLHIQDVPPPKVAVGQVRVRVRAAGLGFVEALKIAGRYQTRDPLPFVPGTEFSGIIDQVGTDVPGWKAGDRVFGSASARRSRGEEISVPARELSRIPDHVSFAQAAAVPVNYLTASYGLKRTGGPAARAKSFSFWARQGELDGGDHDRQNAGGERHRGGLDRGQARLHPRASRGPIRRSTTPPAIGGRLHVHDGRKTDRRDSSTPWVARPPRSPSALWAGAVDISSSASPPGRSRRCRSISPSSRAPQGRPGRRPDPQVGARRLPSPSQAISSPCSKPRRSSRTAGADVPLPKVCRSFRCHPFTAGYRQGRCRDGPVSPAAYPAGADTE